MKRIVVASFLIAVIGVGTFTVINPLSGEEPQFQAISESALTDYEYVIPEGTGKLIDAGEAISIIPAELQVHVGESIRIVNNDERGHIVGIFFVGPGETLSQSFTSAGTLSGGCTIHPSGAFTLQVLEQA